MQKPLGHFQVWYAARLLDCTMQNVKVYAGGPITVYPLSTNRLPFRGSEMCAPQRPSGTVDRRRFPGQQIGPVASK